MDFIGLPQYCKAFLGRCDVIASSTIAKTIDPHTYISRQFLLPAAIKQRARENKVWPSLISMTLSDSLEFN